ncbi:MAG: DUF3127 domain-containing protein [Bacteroidales bacterium]|nr:DUF3127 domain-containing protein [Bacteroidales bacterium]
MELKGIIKKVLPLQTGEGKNGVWKKQEFVMEYGDAYPKLVCFNLWGDNVEKHKLKIDDDVTISFDVESKEFNGKYYTTITEWKVSANDNAVKSNENLTPGPSRAAQEINFENSDGGKNDLPF